MAKRRTKKRTDAAANSNGPAKPGEKIPKSMVIRIGASEVGQNISQLVKDVREVMEPHTASRLKERRGNRLRDFVTMAGPLGVTHLLLFSKSENGNTNLRLAITPRGPTLHFRVSHYSLCKDIVNSLKRSKGGSNAEHVSSPLLVMNNFNSPESSNSSVPKHLESLTTTIFQSLFAPINPQKTPLSSIRRILLLDRKVTKVEQDEPPFVLQFRHYSISTPVAKSSLPRSLRKLHTAAHVSQPKKKSLPNLGRLGDVSDFLLDPTAAAGFTSASDTEQDTDAEVEVLAPSARRAPTRDQRQQMRDAQRSRIEDQEGSEDEGEAAQPQRSALPRDRVEKKAIKLTEIGPRMTLRLTKVEEGLCGGKIMWHEYIHKTKAEVKDMEQKWEQRRREKEERRRIQRENVEKKKKDKRVNGGNGNEDDESTLSDMGDDDFWDDDDEFAHDGEEELEEDVEMEVEGA